MKKLINNKLFLKILSLLIAIGLWAFVLYTVKPTTQKTYKSIPVTYKGEYVLDGENLAILKNTPPTADVEIKGARVDVAKIDPSNITVSVSVDNIKKAGTYSLDYNVKVAGSNISVLSVNPSSANITVETKKQKNIPLVVKKTEKLSGDNEILDTDLLMDSIVISGPVSVIEKITKAVTYIDQSHIKDGQEIELPYVFYDKNNKQIANVNSIDPSYRQAKITCHILYKDVIPVNPVLKGNPSDSYAIDSTSSNPKTITVFGPKNLMESLTSANTAPIDISGLSEAQTYNNIAFNLPSGISVYGKTTAANVTVNVAERLTQNIPITSLKTKNSTDQSRFEFKDTLNVAAIGTSQNLQNAGITATIDITGLSVGKHDVPVFLTSTNPYITINGTYTATINVTD